MWNTISEMDGGQRLCAVTPSSLPADEHHRALHPEFLLTIVTPDGINALGGGWYNAGTNVVLQPPRMFTAARPGFPAGFATGKVSAARRLF